MKTFSKIISPSLSQSLHAGEAEQLFYEGYYQEIGLGELEEAIAAYEKSIAEHSDNVVTAAKAQLRIGLCKAIYKLEDNVLTLASSVPGGETRPNSFEPSGRTRVYQLRLQSSNQE